MTATQTQIRRGTSGDVVGNVPALGEIWYNTSNKRLHVGDGATYGGARIPNAADIQAGTYTYAAAGGTANAITVSTDTNPASLTSGLSIRVKIASANTGAATLKWGSLTATAIKKYSSGSKADLDANDLEVDRIYSFDYDGTDFVLFQSGGASGKKLSDIKIFESSGTWTKPSGLIEVIAIALGGGGEGENSGGVTGANGGSSSFGAHCSATGGQGGQSGTRTPGTGSGGDKNFTGETGSLEYGGAAPSIGLATSIRTYGTTGQAATGYGAGGAGYNLIGGCGGGASRKKIAAASLGSTETVTVGTGGSSHNGGDGGDGVVVIMEFTA